MNYTVRDTGIVSGFVFLNKEDEEGRTSFYYPRGAFKDAFEYFGQTPPEIKKTSETAVPKKVFILMEEEAAESRSFIR